MKNKTKISLAISHPDITKQWHPTKNGELKPTDFTAGSSKKVWWKCDEGHEWEATINNRTKGYGCPYCSGRYAIQGITDLATLCPDIAKEWHPTKNGNLKPTDVAASSRKKVWWKCEHGHEWEVAIHSRTQGTGCPYCAGRKVLIGFNDLATTNPDIAKQWHPTKNGELKPTDVSAGSSKKVWWKCEHGHEWEATIVNRTSRSGCPYCSRKYAIQGITDLATTHPDIAKQWHPTKNGELKPTDVSAGSNKKVWWQCEEGHEWFTTINNRTKGCGCSYCSNNGTSRPEMRVLYYTQKHILANVSHRIKIHKVEFDVFFEFNGKKYAIEYDGYWSHKDKEKEDLKKNLFAQKNNIELYRLREYPLTSLNNYSIDFVFNPAKKSECEEALEKVLSSILKKEVQISFNEDNAEINNFTERVKREKSLATQFPEIAKEWHPAKNLKLKPEHVSAHSDKKVWWKCEHGHEWEAAIYSRTRGSGCPYCANRKVLQGFNDLATKHPNIAKQWNLTQNNSLKPTNIAAYSNKKVWWQCEHGHEWEATIASRTKGNNGCPYCAGQKVSQGFNDLVTTRPDIAKQWHPTKNNGLKPTDVTAGSGKKVWWKCEKGHEWEATVVNRTNLNSGCPYCKAKERKNEK